MKKKLLSIMLAVSLAATVIGCGATLPENSDTESGAESRTVQEEENAAETLVDESTKETGSEEESVSEQKPVSEEETTEATNSNDADASVNETTEFSDLTFADLAGRQFEFCSGAGGWMESFTIEKDGLLVGHFNDSNMGSTGEGYENGTCYSSTYTGHFTNLTKVNEYTYTMELADISYKEPVNTEEISSVDQVKYIYTGSYCLRGTDTFTIYLPGTPLAELSEEVLIWIRYANDSEEELTMITIVDETNDFGIYSYDRPNSLEDAQLTHNSYKYSYDYYNELLTEAATTAEMVEYTATMYEFSDECLNYIWRLVRYNTEEEKYNEILAEQREWIAEKEAQAEEAAAEFEGGSMATVAYNQALADMTIKRCEELIGYLE